MLSATYKVAAISAHILPMNGSFRQLAKRAWPAALVTAVAAACRRIDMSPCVLLSGRWKGGLSLAFMTVLAVLMVLAVLESTLPSFCLSYKIQCQETTVTFLTVLAVVAVSVVTARKPNFLAGYSGVPKKLEKKSLCPIFVPCSVVSKHLQRGELQTNIHSE